VQTAGSGGCRARPLCVRCLKARTVSADFTWAAYLRGDTALIKRYATDPTGRYPDLGCNTEMFTNESMLELETLGPLVRLEPGAETIHDEHWSIIEALVGDTDDDLDRDLLPLVRTLPR